MSTGLDIIYKILQKFVLKELKSSMLTEIYIPETTKFVELLCVQSWENTLVRDYQIQSIQNKIRIEAHARL